MAAHHRLSDVYGIARELPLNYVARSVDTVFVESLTRDKHIVVYGSSKQGKTSLRKYNLKDEDYYVFVTCSNRWTSLAPLHTAILKAAGYTVEQSTTRTAEGGFKVTAKLEGSAGLPLVAKGKVAAEGAGDARRGQQITTAPLELDPNDVNDIISALRHLDFKRYIVLEDFHYLPDDTQRDFAVALKAFHEGSDLCFIVVGTGHRCQRRCLVGAGTDRRDQ